MPLPPGLDVRSLQALDSRELQALIAVIDADSLADVKVREQLESLASSRELVTA
jgi:hypothetical protein